MSVLDITNRNHINRGAFFDGDVGIQRYDSVKYPAFDKLTDKQLGFFGGLRKLIFLEMLKTSKS
tara:strand:- start:35 stop:226 length:192 start_codon:yes stop_codon:yes gene_type:complete